MTRQRHLMLFGLVSALLFSTPGLSAQRLPAAEQVAPLVDVRNQFLTDAERRLGSLGFRNIRVAHQWMTDMPGGVVLWQYPVPPQQGVPPRWRTADEIVLIVVQEWPVLPDLSAWRADHALTLVNALGLAGSLRAAADAGRSVVTSQSLNPGPVEPGNAVTLTVEPMAPVVETVQLPGTLEGTDTVLVAAPTGERAPGVAVPVVVLIAAGALGLGGAGGAAASALVRRPPVPSKPQRPSAPERPDESRPAARRVDVAAFEPVTVDEMVWVTHGSARREGGAHDRLGDGPGARARAGPNR
jgi:hypothetical protein